MNVLLLSIPIRHYNSWLTSVVFKHEFNVIFWHCQGTVEKKFKVHHEDVPLMKNVTQVYSLVSSSVNTRLHFSRQS